MHPSERTIYTVGYMSTTLALLMEQLVALDALLIDIRFNPSSRNPQWRQSYLVKYFGERYRHMQALGNANYQSNGPTKLVAPEQAEIELSVLAKPFVLMCACGNHRTCHRTDAAQYLADQWQCKVEHLYPHAPKITLQPAEDVQLKLF